MSVWVYGIVEPGWYTAKQEWDESYAQHLRSLGYHVIKAAFDKKPKEVPA